MASVTLLDYGMGNLRSVTRALEAAGLVVERSVQPGDGAIVLPGVGAFPEAARRLRESEAWEGVAGAMEVGRPVLGICLGMQLLFEESDEFETTAGFGWLRGRVESLAARQGSGVTVPNMGWHRLTGLGDPFVYLAHSFGVASSPDAVATLDHGGTWVAAARRDNVFGVQFHPEKSGPAGITLLRDWVATR